MACSQDTEFTNKISSRKKYFIAIAGNWGITLLASLKIKSQKIIANLQKVALLWQRNSEKV